MSDITANVVVSQPAQLFTLARSFKANTNGKIYIGKIDTDPVQPENRIQLYLENEDGSHVPVAQPIIINAGGYPVYNGQIAKFVTVEGHSMAIYNASGVQEFYYPNVLKYDPDQFKAKLSGDMGFGYIGGADYDGIRSYSGELLKCYCYGRENILDGGFGFFEVDTSDLTSLDNDGTIIIDAAGRRWKRQLDGSIHFKWWGPDLTGATDSLAKLNSAATLSVANGMQLILPSGTIGILDEFIPPDGLDITGYGNSLVSVGVYSTAIKWIGPVSNKKSVIRCSRSPIGTTPTDAVNGVRITNIIADAANKASHSFYFRYFTNESHCDQITAIGAREVGAAVYQSWFCSFGTIVAHDNYGQGVVIGYPIVGETDDIGVQAVNFDRIRTHTNGLTHNFVPDSGSPTRYKGAGLITRSSGCTYNNIQSERNFGFGWIETSPRSSNEFGSYYTEFNGVSDGSNGYGFLCPDDVGGLKGTVINSVTLFSREQFFNESEKPVGILNFSKAVDAFNSVFNGSGGFRILGGNSEAATQNQSESNWAEALYAIPYVMLRSDFDVSSTSSLNAGCVLPPGTTKVKIHIMFKGAFPGGKFAIGINGAPALNLDEPAHPYGFVIERDVTLASPSLIITLSSTEISAPLPTSIQVSMGRFNNGEYSKIFKFR